MPQQRAKSMSSGQLRQLSLRVLPSLPNGIEVLSISSMTTSQVYSSPSFVVKVILHDFASATWILYLPPVSLKSPSSEFTVRDGWLFTMW